MFTKPFYYVPGTVLGTLEYIKIDKADKQLSLIVYFQVGKVGNKENK